MPTLHYQLDSLTLSQRVWLRLQAYSEPALASIIAPSPKGDAFLQRLKSKFTIFRSSKFVVNVKHGEREIGITTKPKFKGKFIVCQTSATKS